MIKSPNAQRLYDDLRRQIERQVLPPGSTIPSENELAERYAISRPTVRKMLGRLCGIGLLERRMGKGTFVKQTRPDNPNGPDRPFMIGTDSIGQNLFYYSDIAWGIRHQACGEHIYLNMLDPGESARGKVPEHVEALLFARELLPEKAYSKFAAAGLPVVHINRKCEYPEVGYVSIDHEAEAERAVTLMLQAGCRRVMLFANPPPGKYSAAIEMRARGWENACRKILGTVPKELINPVLPKNRQDFDHWLRQLKPDGFFFVTLAQYDFFRLDYVRCTGSDPDHLRAVVFDDLDAAFPERYPTVNFIRMPLTRITRKCIEYLWRKRNDPSLPPIREILPCDVILRTEL